VALISVMSAKGAPGATTTAMLLANLWPAPTVLVDADPLGGDIAMRLRGEHGPLDTGIGMMTLLPAARRQLGAEAIGQHTQTAVGGQQLLGGLPGPEQAAAAAPLWPVIASAFAGLSGADVVADIGQTNSLSAHLALADSASAVLCVFRPTAWSAVHTRSCLDALSGTLNARDRVVGIVGVARPSQTADLRAAAEGIRAGLPWVRDYGMLAHDEDAVVMYEGGVVHRPERTLLARSGAQIASRVHADLGSKATPGADEAAGIEAELAAEAAIDPTGGRPPRQRGSRRAPRRRRDKTA